MKFLPLYILFYGLANSLPAQGYYEYIQLADSLYQKREFQAAARAYDQAFAQQEGADGFYYMAAQAHAMAGEEEKAFQYLEKAVDKGWRDIEGIKTDETFKRLKHREGWEALINKFETALGPQKLNKPLMERLEKILARDQLFRKPNFFDIDKLNKEELAYWEYLAQQTDSLNIMEVTKIIDEYGWLGRSEVLEMNTTLWLVIQHASLDLQEKYLPLLRESVAIKESKGEHLALLEDRIRVNTGKKQIYGSQIRLDDKTGKPYVWPIEDIENVNQRRAKVGLITLEEYLKRWNLTLDDVKNE